MTAGSKLQENNAQNTKNALKIIHYSAETSKYKEITKIEDVLPLRDSSTVNWIDFEGLPSVSDLKKIGDHFKLHSLVLEDIRDSRQRIKLEDYDNHMSFIIKILHYDSKKEEILIGQVNIIFGNKWVLSFHDSTVENVFNTLRDSIGRQQNRIHASSSDYLVYSIIDRIIDDYDDILEKICEKINDLELEVIANTKKDQLSRIHLCNKKLNYLRKLVWNFRDLVNLIETGEYSLFTESIKLYVRDVQDKILRLLETIENYRETTSSLTEIYLSSISNRLNEVMKVLTIISTIFIPLGVLVGLYGMNFEYLPELKWHYGYFMVLGLMAVIVVGMLWYFKKKKWL